MVIVGHRYGSLVPNEEYSFSEAEYNEGWRLSRPCLIYLRDDEVPVLPRYMERDPDKLRRLEKWKATLRDRHTTASFKDGNDLAFQVTADLGRTIKEIEEADKIKAQRRDATPDEMRAQLLGIFDDAVSEGVAPATLLGKIRRTVSNMVAARGSDRPSVFVSYSREDEAIVSAITSRLAGHGIEVWRDVESIRAGDNFVDAIRDAILRAKYILFFISKKSLASPWMQQEIALALHRGHQDEAGARLIPIVIEPVDVSEMPVLLRTYHFLDLSRGDFDIGVEKLIKVMQEQG